MPTTPRPAYIWDANSNDWAPLAGTVDTGQSYNFSAVQNFNAGLVSSNINGGGVTGQNHLINGGMDIWQRGTSFAIGGPGTVVYTADRWTCYSGNTGTITRDTSFMPAGFESSLKFTSTINNSGIDFYQLIETKNVIPLQGKTVTLSAYVAGTNGKTASGMTAYYSTTNDDMIYLTSGVLMQNIAIPSPLSSTSFQRISTTFTVPVTAKTIRIGLMSNVLNNTEFINWTGVQLEVGSVATPFSRAGGTISTELAACQRYYQSLPNAIFLRGLTSSSAGYEWYPPTVMRTVPSASLATTSPYWESYPYATVGSLTNASLNATKLTATGGTIVIPGTYGTTPVQYYPSLMDGSNIKLSAEL
jgi:hypothetical protein